MSDDAPSDDVPEDWLSEEEILRQTGVSRRDLYRWIRAGLVPQPKVRCHSRNNLPCLSPAWKVGTRKGCTPDRCRHPNEPKTIQ